MKVRTILSIVTLAVSSLGTASADDGFTAVTRGLKTTVRFYNSSIVRVTKTLPESDMEQEQNYVVVMQPQNPSVSLSEADGIISARSSELVVKYDRKSGKVWFESPDGRSLLAEKEFGAQLLKKQYMQRFRPQQMAALAQQGMPQGVTPTQSAPGKDTPGMGMGRMRMPVEETYEVSQSFILDDDEVIYGLGQQQDGNINRRGRQLVLEQNNMQIAIPYISSVKGYGLYWDNYSVTTFTDTPLGTSFCSEAGQSIDYYFLYGKGGDGNVALLRELSGKASMVPLWTLGFWQCKERYKSADEVVEVASRYRQLGVPLDAVVQDWCYWGDGDYRNINWNAVDFLNPDFSNSDSMFDRLEKMHVNMMISVWPSFGNQTELYTKLGEMGALYPMETSPVEAKVYDAFNPEAGKLIWDYMNRNMFQKGMDAWWMDATEPELNNTSPGDFNHRTAVGPLRNVRNVYPLFTSKNIYENQRATTSDKRVYILTRSSYLGSQRYGAGSWSGDIRASWQVFKNQIPAGMNFSLCGIPYWNTDIGGWHPFGNVYNTANTDPGYQQCYVRWFQFATFNPMMRSHGTGSPREIYQFGERGYWAFDVQEKYLNLRYRMLPYLYSTAWQVYKDDFSYIRHLSMEAPADRNTYLIDDEFMFGAAFLAAPVVEEDAVSRKVYLPDSGSWYDFWTEERFNGGQTVERETPIDIMPVYVKAGSIVPFTTEKVQYSTEKSWKKLELRVYPGADASFVLYEDKNDGYDYEDGKYTEIPVRWDEASRTLTIGAREGAYDGMLRSRQFVVCLAGTKAARTVSYSGKELKIKL